MTIWSELITNNLKSLYDSCSDDVLQFMLAEASLVQDENGAVIAESISDVFAYLETLENYLGTLYRQRAEMEFEEIIDKGWTHPSNVVELTRSLEIEQKQKFVLNDQLKALSRDLASAKRTAAMASSAKTSFLANMSHEIRTPMNGVLASSELLMDTNLDEEQSELTGLICRSSNSLITILNDILDLSKIEAGKLEFESIPYNLIEVVNDACELNAAKAAKKCVKIQLDVEEGVPHIVKGDPTRYRQVLMNLVGNAIKFTQQGEVSITVGFDKIDNRRYNIIVEISDTGIGIPKDRIDRIFENYAQASDGTTREYGGTGLGLTISKNLIDLMKGMIEVESEEGKGASFTITVPMERVTPRELAGFKDDDAPQTRHYGKKVLVAEDDVINQRVIKKMLAKVGVDADIVYDGGAAIQAANNRKYDLIMMDIGMPVLDGLNASKLILSGSGLNQGTPILALTGSVMKEEKDEFLNAGMHGVMSKPIRLSELIKELDRFFGES